VEGKVILEQSVEQIGGAHKKQIQTYLRLFGLKLGFLLNFGEALMKRGITRAVNGLDDSQPFVGLPTLHEKRGK
jgi:GxxExxY protein